MNVKKGTITETTERAQYLINQENKQRPSSLALPIPNESTVKCSRRLNIDPPCRLKFDPGTGAAV